MSVERPSRRSVSGSRCCVHGRPRRPCTRSAHTPWSRARPQSIVLRLNRTLPALAIAAWGLPAVGCPQRLAGSGVNGKYDHVRRSPIPTDGASAPIALAFGTRGFQPALHPLIVRRASSMPSWIRCGPDVDDWPYRNGCSRREMNWLTDAPESAGAARRRPPSLVIGRPADAAESSKREPKPGPSPFQLHFTAPVLTSYASRLPGCAST